MDETWIPVERSQGVNLLSVAVPRLPVFPCGPVHLPDYVEPDTMSAGIEQLGERLEYYNIKLGLMGFGRPSRGYILRGW